MLNIRVCIGLGEERSVFLDAAERPRRSRSQYNSRTNLAPMHPLARYAVAGDDGGGCAATRMCCALLVAPMTKEVGLPRKRGGHGASANRRAADLYAYEIAPIIAELKASGIRPTAGHRRRIAQATGAHSAGRSERFPGSETCGPCMPIDLAPVQRSRLLVT